MFVFIEERVPDASPTISFDGALLSLRRWYRGPLWFCLWSLVFYKTHLRQPTSRSLGAWSELARRAPREDVPVDRSLDHEGDVMHERSFKCSEGFRCRVALAVCTSTLLVAWAFIDYFNLSLACHIGFFVALGRIIYIFPWEEFPWVVVTKVTSYGYVPQMLILGVSILWDVHLIVSLLRSELFFVLEETRAYFNL